MAKRTLLIDFGGVLTSNVHVSFGQHCAALGLEADRFSTLVRDDPAAGRLLVDVETGRIPLDAFERGLAPLLGPEVSADGLVAGLTAALQPDVAMVDAVRALRAGGVTTVLLSNSLGMDAYAGLDMHGLFDHVVISADVGLRKPSRAIYRHALEVAGTAPEDALFVDDLPANCSGAERVGIVAIHHEATPATVAALQVHFDTQLVTS